MSILQGLPVKLYINGQKDVPQASSIKSAKEPELEADNQTKIGPMIRCHKCGAEAKIISIRQLRSADEPMTVTCKCTGCKRRFTIGD